MLERTIAISGTDHFLQALDHDMRDYGDQHYTCRLALTLTHQLDVTLLQSAIDKNPGIRWIYSAKKRRRLPLQVPSWHSSSNASPKIIQRACEFSDEFFTEASCSPEEPIRFDYFSPSKTLVMSWLHTIVDAHGGETILKSLSSDDLLQKVRWLPSEKGQDPLIKQLEKARSAKEFLWNSTKGSLLSPEVGRTCSELTTCYLATTLTEGETIQVDETCKKFGAGLRKGLFYLSACAQIFSQVIAAPESDEDFIFVPIPQDRRKRGALGPVISNQVTFMYFRFTKPNLVSLDSLIKESAQQMMAQMRDGSLEACTGMMSLFRRLPLRIYRHLIKAPTKGKFASFYFSDTGDSLTGTDRLGENPIASATHYPPNSYPPGFTVVFSRFQGRLSFTIAYLAEMFTEDDVTRYRDQLTKLLTTGT